MRLALLSLTLLSLAPGVLTAETGSAGSSSGGTGNAELDATLRSGGSESRNIEFGMQPTSRTDQGLGSDSLRVAIARCRAPEHADEAEMAACEARARNGR